MSTGGDAVIAKELRGRGAAELESLVVQKREELQQVRFKHALGQLQETHKIKALRRDIACLQTVLGEMAQ